MDRTFDFGPLQIHSSLQGEVEDQPVFKVTVTSPGGSVELDSGTELPLPAEAALFILQEMRKVLRMGPQRHAQLVVMRERLRPEQAREKQEASAKLHAVARAVPGGDAALGAAETALKAAIESEKAEFEAESEEAADAVEETRTVAFDLGPVRMAVEWAGAMPDPEEGMAVFRITAEAPGAPPHAASVATNAPLFSGAARWLLGEMRKILALGTGRYAAEEMTGVEFRTPEESAAYAASLHALASAVGPAGLDHASAELERAAVQERADAEEVELRRLEDEQEEIRRQLDALRQAKRRPRGR